MMLIVDRDEAGALTFAAPLFRSAQAMRSRIRFLGSGNACTDYQSVLTLATRRDEQMAQLAEMLDRVVHPLARWSSCQIELDGVEPTAAWYAPFLSAMRRIGYRVRQQPIESAYVVSLPDNWEAFTSQLHKSFRRKVNKHHRRWLNGEFTLHRTEAPEQIPAALAVLKKLHQQRRAMLGQPGSFADGTFEPFLQSAVTRLSEMGNAEIQWVQVGDRTVASHLVFQHENTISMYVSGVDPGAMDQEPGHMLITASIADALGRGFRKFDFLRGDEHYKRLWTGEPVPMVRCHLTPPARVSQMVETATVWASTVKHRVQGAMATATSPQS